MQVAQEVSMASRDTIAQVGHWQGSLRSPGTIQLWSCSLADTALPARATTGSCTTMRNRIPFITSCPSTQEGSPLSPPSSSPTPRSALPAWGLTHSLRSAESSLAFRSTAITYLTKEQQICYASFIFLLALELL